MVLKFNDFNSVNENFTIIKDRLNMGTTIRFDIFDQGEKVGTINMSTDEYDYLEIPDELGGKCIYLSYIQIDEYYQRRGYFKKAMNWIFNNFRQYDYLVLRVSDDSEVSFHTLKKIYTKLGFISFNPEEVYDTHYVNDYIISPKDEELFMYIKL